MKSLVYFCLFFWMAPLFLAWTMKIRDLLSGPESDLPYDLEQYRIKLRRSAVELAVYTVLMILGVVLAVIAARNLPEAT